MKRHKLGTVANPNRIPIISRNGNIVGNVGRKATTATVSRFLGHSAARLGTFKGRTSWIEQGTNSRPRPVRRPAADRAHCLGSIKS
jgi:hypothetical protein